MGLGLYTSGNAKRQQFGSLPKGGSNLSHIPLTLLGSKKD